MSSAAVLELLADPIAHYPSATVACFDPTEGELEVDYTGKLPPRRHLDCSRLKLFLEKLSQAGAPAVLIGASTGHAHLRDLFELAYWFAAACAANMPGTLMTALVRPEDPPIDLRALMATLGVEGRYPVVFVRPGTNLPKNATVDEVVANMQPAVQAIAAAKLAVGLYSISDVSGVPMLPEVAAKLVAGPDGGRIVAIKVTEANYEQSTQRFLEHPKLRHLKIVQGWDTHIARALREGGRRVGVTSGPMSFAIYQYLHIFDCVARGDWTEVDAAQEAVSVLFRAMQDDPGKFADLQRAKYIMGLGHPLTSTADPQQVERVLAALESLPRKEDRTRLARSLDLMGDGPFHERLLKSC